MNILYIAFKDFSKLHYGASKKVISECRALESLGHTITLIGRRSNSTVLIDTSGNCEVISKHSKFPIGKVQTLIDKECQIRDIEKFIDGKHYEYCYIRFDLCTKSFIRLLKNIRKVCPVIQIEIPTYPYDKEYSGKINKLRLAIDHRCAASLKKYINRIISFYPIPNDEFYGVPVKYVPNGFDFDEISIISADFVPDDIHIAAVSSMRLWHGYERMIEGMHKYYSEGGTRNIILHIVGDGREGSKYKNLVENYKLENRVVFHGAMHGKELDQLLENCTLGLDSLGRHRTGIDVLSSLKSREYGAKGIPFINSCDIDIVDDDFKYFLKVPANESPVDIKQVISFYDRCYKDGSRISIAKEIRAYIEERSSMRTVMVDVLSTLED